MNFEFSVVTGKTIAKLIEAQLPEVVRIIEAAYLAHGDGHSINPNSYFLRFPQRPNSRIIALPAYLGGDTHTSGIKWISSYPDNIQRGFPRASAVLILNDAETGYPFAVLESSIISAARTAASAALAAARLHAQLHPSQLPDRKPQARALGFVGNGLIARYIYNFLLGTGWEVDTVRLHDLNPADAERFKTQVCKAERHRSVTVDDNVQTLLRESDVIVFATTAGTPYVDDPALFSHNPLVLHVSLRDLSPRMLQGANNVVDDIGHVMNANTSPHLLEQQTGNRDFVTGTLAEILTGQKHVTPGRPTLFSPFGLGILDIAVGKWVYDRARASGEALPIPDFFYELTR